MEVQTLRIRITMVTALCILSLTSSASGRDIDVPGDQPDLHQALKIAHSGDRIVLQPGRHLASGIDLPDGVTIIGDRDDPGSVVIDAENVDRVFRAEGIETARIVGVTIIGGRAEGNTSYSSSGGGLFVSSSRVELEAVHFFDNNAHAAGGCIRVSNGEVDIEDCVFVDGRAVKGGGAIDLSYNSSADIHGSVFRGNGAAWGGAISARTGSSCWVNDSVFTGNTTVAPQELGGAFFADYAARVAFNGCVMVGNAARQGGAARLGDALSSFVNCTVTGNAAWESGGAFAVRSGALHVDHSIVAFNQGSALSSDQALLNVTATDIYGNLGGDWDGDLADWIDRDHNLEVDPLFCGVNDLHLQPESPCAAENNSDGLIGALEVGCAEIGILLQQFVATQDQDAVVLTWQITGAEAVEFRLQGRPLSDSATTGWTVDYATDGQPGRFRAVDRPRGISGSLEYTLEARAVDGDWFLLGETLVNLIVVVVPEPLVIDTVYPNPFNPRVNIRYTIGEPSIVEVSIYDIHGRVVMPLTRGARNAGTYTATWDGVAEHGRKAPAGTYILRIVAGDAVLTHKLVMVK